jgi:hypothetical protein
VRPYPEHFVHSDRSIVSMDGNIGRGRGSRRRVRRRPLLPAALELLLREAFLQHTRHLARERAELTRHRLCYAQNDP